MQLKTKTNKQTKTYIKSYFTKLVENNKDISSVWRALNAFIKGTHSRQKEIPHHFTADAFNDYFLSIAETVKSQDHLIEISSTVAQNALLISVSKRLRELIRLPYPWWLSMKWEKHISGMNNKKSSGPDEISNQLLKLASPYIARSLTYIFNLCIEQNVFPSEFQKASEKAFLYLKLEITKNINDYRQSHYCRFCLNLWKDMFIDT